MDPVVKKKEHKVRMLYTMTPELLQRLDEEAARRVVSRSFLVREALKRLFDNPERSEAA